MHRQRRFFSNSISHAHSEFLNMVRNHGDGEIILQRRRMKTFQKYKILEMTIHNPSKHNCISGNMMNDLAKAVEYIEKVSRLDESDFCCLVIRGAGRDTFSAGADLRLVKDVLNTPAKGAQMASFMTDALNRIRNCGLISVCCLNGSALGGGAELATVGDFRIMSDDEDRYVKFLHAKLGASPGFGGAGRLTSIVGRKHAIRLLCSTPQLYAKEALQIGFCDRIVKIENDEDWLAKADEFLQPYIDQPYPMSVKTIKSAIAGYDANSPKEAIENEIRLFKSRWLNEDHRSSIQ